MSMLVLIFGPSLLGIAVLLVVCILTRSMKWVAAACVVAALLHSVSVGILYGLLGWSVTTQPGASAAVGLLRELLIIGWAVIAVVALAKFAVIKHHARTQR